MRKIYTKLSLTILSLLIFQISFTQKVHTPSQLTTNTEEAKNFNGTKSNEAFCVVTGGGGTSGPAKFYLEDPTTFENLAPAASGMYFLGGDFGPNGTWYCTEWMGGLYSFDTVSGDHTSLGNLGITPSGFTYSPAYETYYCCSGDELYKVNMDSYTVESIGPMGNSGDMTGLGADIRGNLYGIDKNDDQLYKIDPITGLATAVGPSGFDFDYLQNCTYDKNNDIMYHAGFWVMPSVFGGLFTYDLETGQATEFTAFPSNQEVTAFAIPWNMPAHGSVTGLVTDAVSGDPVANVNVYTQPVEDPMGTQIQKITGSEGTYSCGVVLPGTYNIIAEHGNYGVAIIENVVVNDGDNLTIDIELQEAPWTVTFHIYTFDGSNPVEGATVNFLNQDKLTDNTGTVVFENVANGTNSFTVDYEGYYQGFGEVEVMDGDAETDSYLYIENNVATNIVIIEEATGTWCGPCSMVAPILDEIVEEGYPVGIIAYHASDPYENSYASARNGYYGIVAYPTLSFNGQDQINNESYEVILSYVEEYMDDETPVTLEFSDVAWDLAGDAITGKVTVENMGPINSENMRLHVALVENHIPEAWQGLDELNFVERTMFPNADGTSIDLTSLNTEEIEFEVTLADILELGNCQIVTFVQDNFTKKIYNGLVYECSTLVGMDENIATENINLYPNPAKGKVVISSAEIIENIQLINYAGQLVLEQTCNRATVNVDVSKIEPGIYFIKAFSNDQVITRKLVIE